MATPILMPKQGNTVEECVLVGWKKKKGEKVAKGEIIADIETDKAVFELESPADGKILETFFQDGDLVPVLVNIGVIGRQGEDVKKFKPESSAAPAAVKAAPPLPSKSAIPQKQAAAVQVPTAEAPAPVQAPGVTFLSPRARRLAQKQNLEVSGITGSGPEGRILERDVAALLKTAGGATFLARRLIKEGYRAPAQGTGINGRIRSADLQEPGVPLSNMRSIIASRMMESLSGTAQYTLNGAADATGLLAARKEIKAGKGSPGYVDVNLNDMVTSCVIQTLVEIPELNAEFIDGMICTHADVDIAFACDTPRGLAVPVIKASQKLTLEELASRIKALTKEAVEGKVSPDDLSGGSLTVSNLGVFGIESFTPIINTPQVAIVGVGAIQLKPVRVKGSIEFIDHIGLSLTADHQAVDGAPAARFLKTLIGKIAEFHL